MIQLSGQSNPQDFKIYEKEVSRKKISTVEGEIISIARISQDPTQTKGDIQLLKSDDKGNILWTKYFGGSGYEYVGSFLQTSDKGFIIVGTTSSFGEGNNNVYLVKTDKDGNEIWSKTYGGFFNEYGDYVKEEKDGTLTIKGRKQFCKSKNVGTDCEDKSWLIRTDAQGEIISEKIKNLKR
jgi:hypothetical protein